MMKNHNIDADKQEITVLFEKYVKLILEEYGDIIPDNLKNKLHSITDFSSSIKIENTGTITLYANPADSTISLPLDAYKAIDALSTTFEYGSEKSHKTYNSSNMIINDNTYRDFVEHIILSGASPLQYFEEILLHETMHICGSEGSNALTEGFTELKTREMAQKYGLQSSCCGYPKETKIAYELQQIFGKDISDKLAFSDLNTRFNILRSNFGEEAVQLYANVYSSMEKQFRPYMDKKYPGFDGIRKKCDEYDRIDYSETYSLLNQFKNNRKEDDNRMLFKVNKNIQWTTPMEKQKYVNLKDQKEKTYTKPKKKVLIKTMRPYRPNGFVEIFALNLLAGIGISVLFLISLVLFSR